MQAAQVLEILDAFAAAELRHAVDGGWGVDALVGEQTRPHDDLDLVVELGAVPRIRALLRSLGFGDAEDELPVRFVMTHPELGSIDFHPVRFDPAGGGVQAQPGGGRFRYPPEGFVTGRIQGRVVPCISAPVQLLCHLGYEPAAKDRHDVRLLHERCGTALPPPYDCEA